MLANVQLKGKQKDEGEEREADFRMRFNDSHSPRPMRLLCIRPEKIMFLDFERRGRFGIGRAS
jgi:hypothetical protein